MQISELKTAHQSVSIEESIVRESDFYSELKHASENGQKDTFALILSMLTTDANELDQFQQPKTKPYTNKSDLYKKHFIQQTELRGDLSSERSISFNQLLTSKQRQSIQLDLAIKPEALLAKDTNVIDGNVFNNLDINARTRFIQHQTDDASVESNEVQKLPQATQDREIDVESWFNVLEQARTLSMTA